MDGFTSSRRPLHERRRRLAALATLSRRWRQPSGHAGELVEDAEVVLQGDGGEGLVLGLTLHAFMVTAWAGPASGGLAGYGCVLVDEAPALSDDVVLVLEEQPGLELRVADQGGAGRLVQVSQPSMPRPRCPIQIPTTFFFSSTS